MNPVTKVLNGKGAPANDLGALEAERGRQAQELQRLEATIGAPEGADVDALEAALNRRAAVTLRMGAVDRLIGAERARLEAVELQRKRTEAARLTDAATERMTAVREALERAHEEATAAAALFDQAGALTGDVPVQASATAARGCTDALVRLWPLVYTITGHGQLHRLKG
jgi:hypothetical protein